MRFSSTLLSRALALFILAAGGDVLVGQTREPASRATGTASLAGRVLRDGTPVARASVSISTGEGQGSRETATDDQGRFSFDGLPAGRFLVTASKVGWVTSHYGSMRPGRPPGVRVAVENGARATIEIPMLPGGVIAGRIVDETGRPMPRQWPWLLEQRLVGDKKMLARASMPYTVGNFERSTDDRGEFRLFGLIPGTYYLVVNPSITAGARLTTADEVRWAMQPPGEVRGSAPAVGPVAGYASMYFPGTSDPAAAEPIVVGPGEVRDGLTFRVGFTSASRVAGVAQRQDGAPAVGATIVLEAREAQVMLEGSSRRVTADKEGRFAFPTVSPGDYRISARAASTPAPPPVPPAPVAAGAPPPRPAGPAPQVLDLWGQTDVVVSGRDVEGVGLTLAPASAISGRIVLSGTTLKPPDDLTQIRLQFIAPEALLRAAMTGEVRGGSLHNATVAADGTFRVEGLPPDWYLPNATWPGMRTGDGTAGWWLTTIHVEGRDLGDAPIDVRPNVDVREVTVAFRDRIGAIEGMLADAAGRPAPEHFVLAFPVDRASWTPMSRRAVPPVRPGTDGRFRLAGLLAGEYYLAVVTAIAEGESTDPAFLEALLPAAIKIRLAEGETRRQDLKIGK